MSILSFRSSLEQILPLCYNRIRNSSSTTHSYACSIPEAVEAWDTESEMKEFYERLQVDNKLQFEAMRPNRCDFHDVVDVSSQLRQTLLRTAELLVQGTHQQQIMINIASDVDGTRQVVYYPDMMAWQRSARHEEPRLLLPIEIKKPHREGHERDLRELYRTENNLKSRAHKIIEQAVGYMYSNSCEYGLITSYVNTYALKLDGRSNVLHMSRPFRYDGTSPTVLKVLYFLLSQALDSPGLCARSIVVGAPSNSEIRNQRGYSPPGDSNIPPASPSTIRDKYPLKSRRGNRVFRGTYQEKSVILKRAHVSKSEKLLRETEMYRYMESLQGSAIPLVLGSGREGDHVYIVLEDCGEPIKNTMYHRRAVSRAIGLLHAMKVYHGDLEWRNVVCRGSNVRIIDFEESEVVEDTCDLKAEEDALLAG